MKNVVHPHGYTFLSYLVLKNETELVKEALLIKGVKYMTDKYENTPLLLALKRKNPIIMELLLNYIGNIE